MRSITWQEVEVSLTHAKPISEGFGGADRRIVTLESGETVFVKIALNPKTTERLQQEIRIYKMLQAYHFSHIPQLLTYSPTQTAMVLENLDKEEQWEWSSSWTVDRLAKTLEAMDELAELKLNKADRAYLTKGDLHAIDLAWESSGKASLKALHDRLSRLGLGDYKQIDFIDLEKRAAHFIFINDHLVHNDMRQDNCAWNPRLRQVKIIDWDWAQLGDRRIDIAALLVDVYKSGLNITDKFEHRLDNSALSWLANYWFKCAATPIWEGGDDHLRDVQLQSAIAAYELLNHS